MNKIIFAILSLSFFSLRAVTREVAPQPIVAEFVTQEMTVFHHLATILESATQLALEHDNADDLHQNVASRRIILTNAMTSFLNFDVKTLDEELINPDPEHFVSEVVGLFEESYVKGLTLEISSIESSRPDDEMVSELLRMRMMGYYFAVLKQNNFDDSNLNVDWRFQEIQMKMQGLMTAKMAELVKTFQQMMFMELSERAKKFSASFKVHHQQVVVILKSFKSYAIEVLIDQLRTFYFDLATNPQLVVPAKAKDTFQRTIDMWMVAYKLCERDCETRHFATLVPNFLEDMVLTRIEQNEAIVRYPLVKTFYAKFLAFLLQQNFQNNTPSEDEDNLMDLNQRYAMFIYRLFFSRQSRKMNKKLSNFLKDVYGTHALNFMFPEPELEQQDAELFALRKDYNQRYIIDLILHLDFPELDDEDVQDADKERTQEISFSDEDVLTLVQSAPMWFAFDLDRLNTEELILNWFVDYNDPAAFEDYQVMYETLAEFRNNYKGVSPGEDLDAWLDNKVADVEELEQSDPKRQRVLSKFWLMKAINMINVLSGNEYDETFSFGFPPDVNEDIIMYFRRIVTRSEFAYLKKAMLQIYAYYKPEQKVYSTDLENDKFLYEVFEDTVECEKLPEILGTEVTTINVTFRDDEEDNVMDIKKKKTLDNGSSSNSSEQSSPIRVEESSNSSDVKSRKSDLPVVNPTAFDRIKRSTKTSESSHDEVIEVVDSNKTSHKTPVVVSQKTSPRVEVSSENTSVHSQDREAVSPKDREDMSEQTPSRKSKIKSTRTSEVIEHSIETSENSSSKSQELPQVDNKTPKTSKKSVKEESSYNWSQDSSQVIHTKSSNTSEIKHEKSFKTPQSSEKKTSHKSNAVVVNEPSHKTSPVVVEESSHNTTPIVVESSSNNSSQANKSYKTATSHPERVSTKSSTKNIVQEKSRKSQVVIDESSNSSTVDIEEVSPTIKPKTSPSTSNKIREPSHHSTVKSHETSEIKVEVSSNSSSQVNQRSHVSPQIDAKTLKDSEASSPANRSQSPKKSAKSGQLDQERNKSQVKDTESHSTPKSGVIETSENSSTKSSPKVIVDEESETSQRKPSKSHKTIADIQGEIESQVNESSSNSSIDSSEKSSNRQGELDRGNKSHTTVQESSSNSSKSSESSHSKSTRTGEVHPLTPNDKSEVSKESHSAVVHRDEDQQRRNLVYEVSGRLTPDQRRTFEFSDDLWASVKDLKIKTDEYGNEVEYVYVQVVRKDSDCYEELLKYT